MLGQVRIKLGAELEEVNIVGGRVFVALEVGLDDLEPDPRTTELTQAVDRLSEAYKIRRVAVVQAIYGQPSRGPSEIAKAFRFGKKKQ